MKILTSVLIGSLLLFSAACDNTAKTTSAAPEPDTVPATPTAQTTQAAKEDAQSEVRRKQLNSDIRSREERKLATGGDADRASSDLSSEVRSKLEANIPSGVLTINAIKDGTVTVLGTVSNQDQLAKIEPLTKEIKGVKNVVVKVTISPPKP